MKMAINILNHPLLKKSSQCDERENKGGKKISIEEVIRRYEEVCAK